MTFIARVLTLVLVALGLVSLSAPATAATSSGQATGLIVSYEPGYEVLAPNGQFTGENFVAADIVSARDLGLGLVALSFDERVSEARAEQLAANLRLDPRVKSVDVDRFLPTPAASIPSKVVYSATIKPASAPLLVKAVDAWSAATPTVAKVRVTWSAPKYLFAAKLSSYRVERSVNNGAWVVVTASQKATVRMVTYSYPSEAGSLMRFRIRAVTKVGSASRIGAISAVATVTPTSAPQPVRMIGYSDNFVNEPLWLAQSVAARGGLKTTITATATPADAALPKATCSTSVNLANSCTLSNFETGKEYRLALVAKNARGSAPAFTVVLPSDPYFYQQWYLFGQYGINAAQAWTQTRGSASTTVAVLDTGITNHVEFSGRLLPGQDFVSESMGSNDGDGWDADATDPGDYASLADASVSSWHGTHVAGLIAAATNGQGVSGVAPNVKVLPVRIMGSQGGSQSDLVAGVNWAAGFAVQGAVPAVNPNPAKVINISMGTATPTSCGNLAQPTATLNAFQSAKAAGVTIITSAGNGDANNHPIQAAYSYPGNCLGSINVGATGSEGKAASYSNYGFMVDISAPGGDNGIGCSLLDSSCKAQTSGTTSDSQGTIISTFNEGNKGPTFDTYLFDEGTSMSAPLVAGVAALIYAVRPNVTPDQVWKSLQSTAAPFKAGTTCAATVGQELDQMCGVGILDANAAVSYAIAHY